MPADQFVITARPPVRAYALAAMLASVGAALIVLPVSGGWKVALVVVGIVLVVLGAALAATAVIVTSRQRVVVELDADGYRVDTVAGVREGTWGDVTRVTAAPGRITLYRGDTERTHLVAPGGHTARLDDLATAIGRRLDENRGYKVFEG